MHNVAITAEKHKLYEGTVFTSLGNLFLLFGNPLVQGTVIRIGSLITLTSEPPNRLPGVTKFRGLIYQLRLGVIEFEPTTG